LQHTQIADYLNKPQQLMARAKTESPFLSTFYEGNQPLAQPLGDSTQGI